MTERSRMATSMALGALVMPFAGALVLVLGAAAVQFYQSLAGAVEHGVAFTIAMVTAFACLGAAFGHMSESSRRQRELDRLRRSSRRRYRYKDPAAI